MAIFIMFSCYFALFIICEFKYNQNFLKSVSITGLVSATLILFFTNILSIFNLLTKANIAIFWLFILIILSIIIFINNKKIRENFKIKINNLNSKNFSIAETSCITLIVIFSIIMLTLSFINVPNNYDSMTYHLARVANWSQNKSVNYYATSIPRQIFSPVLSEYMILHTYILSGTDLFANSLQCFSYILTGLFIYGICRKINISKTFSLIASLLFYSMPIAIAESITTQVDLVGCLWLSIFLYYVIDLLKIKSFSCQKETLFPLICCSVSIGLCYLTKTNICIIMAVFLLLLLFVRIKKKDSIKILLFLITISFIIILLITSETFIRNYLLFGSILPSDYLSKITIGSYSVNNLIVNSYKNLCTLSINNYFGKNISNVMKNIGNTLSNIFKVNINASNISYNNMEFNISSTYHHDKAGAPLLIIFALISIILLIIFSLVKLKKLKTKKFNINKYFILFCYISFFVTISIVRWQPWITRLVFPSCICICIITAKILNYIFENSKFKKIAVYIILILIIITSLPSIKYNSYYALHYYSNNFKDRFQYYFVNNYGIEKYYSKICNYILSNNYKKILLYTDEDSYEYPLWYKLKKNNVTIKSFGDNITTKYFDLSFDPDCIIVINSSLESQINKNNYTKVILDLPDNLILYEKQENL